MSNSHLSRIPFVNNSSQTDLLLENLPVALVRLDIAGIIQFANSEARGLLGAGCKKSVLFTDIVEGLGRSMRDRLREVTAGASERTTEMGRCVRDGQEVFLQISLMRTNIDDGCCFAVLSDKTELKMLEAQFVQSQKMEAVGQLAGGIAHDFNNLLTAINGHSDLLLLRHQAGDSDYGDLVQIRQNCIRAAALVRQLLAFSRKQTLRPQVATLDDILAEVTPLLNRLLGEKVSLKILDLNGLHAVRIDVQQFEQVIMNLVVNARDAMPDGGEVVISAKNQNLPKSVKRDRATIPKGDYVVVCVRDQGCGIDEETLPKIFEPFFTTKNVGEGTGLGLSTVYGIIKQTGGFVFAQSDIGQGSSFDIFLPAHLGTPDKSNSEKPLRVSKDCTSEKYRILLVEDEVAVRSFAVRALKLKGYSVTEAESGAEALEKLAACSKPFDMFVSDVVMPGIDGPTWVRKALKKNPDTAVIFVSGYSIDAFSEGNGDAIDAAFLAKPFSLQDLTAKVAEIVESKT